jgi:hypothetical protein
MKVKTLSALAGVGTALILSGTANAAFTGLSVELFADGTVQGGAARDVWRIYANFDNAGDRLTAVFGNGVSPMVITSTSGAFFNPGGSATNGPPSAGDIASYPQWAFGTYATIGDVAGTPDTANVGFSPGFPVFLAANLAPNTNIGWFTAGPLPQGAPVAGRVMIMQLAVNDGLHAAGSVGIQYRPAGAASDEQVNNNAFNTIPAPGALALLGLAGLVGSRRRRG